MLRELRVWNPSNCSDGVLTLINHSMTHELFTGQIPKDSKGVRARVKGGMKV
jgi:hypothetical protein